MFGVRPEPTSVKHLSVTLLKRRLLALPTNMIPGCKVTLAYCTAVEVTTIIILMPLKILTVVTYTAMDYT
jgi:hypothetical protein